jgi:hypothetical protein
MKLPGIQYSVYVVRSRTKSTKDSVLIDLEERTNSFFPQKLVIQTESCLFVNRYAAFQRDKNIAWRSSTSDTNENNLNSFRVE